MSILDPEPYSTPRRDLVALVAGVLVFFASFLPWYGVTFNGGLAESGVSSTVNAWHGLAGIGLILLLFSLVVTAAEPFFGEGVSRRPVSGVAAILACVGALFVVIKSFDLPGDHETGLNVGLRWGGWILIVLVLVQAVVSVMRFVRGGDQDAASAA
jgi:heme/copper-type cytochrome/quinol oxidase subunit 3